MKEPYDSNLKLTITSGCWGLGVFPVLFSNSDLSAMRMITLIKKKKECLFKTKGDMRFKNKGKRQVSGHYHQRRELARGLWPALWVQRLDLSEHPENMTEDSGLRPRWGLAGKGLVWAERLEGTGHQPFWLGTNSLPTLWMSEGQRQCPRSLRTPQGSLGPCGLDLCLLVAGRGVRSVSSKGLRTL